jgi:hypothetical protein
LDRPVSPAQIARAFRWYRLSVLGATLDFSDVVPASNFAGLPNYKTPREAAALERVLIQGTDICTLNRERLRASQTSESSEQESTELSRQLRRIVHFLMTGEESPQDKPLWLSASPSATEDSGIEPPADLDGDRAIALESGYVTYRDAGRSIRRYSPMVARLAMRCGRDWSESLSVGARQ